MKKSMSTTYTTHTTLAYAISKTKTTIQEMETHNKKYKPKRNPKKLMKTIAKAITHLIIKINQQKHKTNNNKKQKNESNAKTITIAKAKATNIIKHTQT